MLNKRSLIFLEDDNGKVRPYVCLEVFKNNANIVYNYLVAPITSKKTVGMKNLVKIRNIRLKSPSYVKLCNLQTINVDKEFKIIGELEIRYYKKIINNFYDRFFKG